MPKGDEPVLSPDDVILAVDAGESELFDRCSTEYLLGVQDDDGITPLLAAVKRATVVTAKKLVECLGMRCLGDRNHAGLTCLHLACERKRAGEHGAVEGGNGAAMLSMLLDSFKEEKELPHVDAKDKQGFAPLHVACMSGDFGAARCLLKHGADVGAANDKGSTPLHWACSRGHTKIVKLLVGVYGAEFAQPAGSGSTPLHWAASKDEVAVIEILLGTYCAQVDVKDDKGCTPTIMAALNGHLRTVELLVDRFKAKITVHDRKRTNLLHAACEMGHAELASALIGRYKMAVEEPDRKGLTPLARAAQRNQVDVFQLLVEKHGARLNTLTTIRSGLLHVACEAGALDVAKILLEEHGFEVDSRNADGDTPALLAAAHGHADVLALLVDSHGASLDTADARGAGPLHKACQRRQSTAASVLLESYGLPVDKADPSGATPLHVAARAGDAALVELLTGPIGKADPCLRDGDGNQPLHIAASCGHLDVVKVMAEKAGADLSARDRSEKSALDVAVGKAYTEIADYLRNVLPDKGEHHDHCERRRGFKRAGRWMRLCRGGGYLQDLALDNVHLLPMSTLLHLGKFPSHYDASRKKLLVKASDIPPQAQVLLVTHPWELPGNPDPSGRQFVALRRFVDKANVAGGGAGFEYVWVSFSCASSNRMKPTFKTHLHNVLTAWCLADRALVLPETVTRRADGLTCTDLVGYVERGWCCVELLCVMHLGVPTTVHFALEDALADGVSNCRLSPSGVADEPRSSVFEALATPHLEIPLSEGTDKASLVLSSGRCVSQAVTSASKRLAVGDDDGNDADDAGAAAHAEKTVKSSTDGISDTDGGDNNGVVTTTQVYEDVAKCLWSSDAEGYLDATTQLVETVLKTLDDEISRDVEAAVAAAAAAAAGGAGDKDGDASGEGENRAFVPEDSKAGKLLARILNLGLGKGDVEEDGGGGGSSGGEAMANPLVRELYEKLGAFSNVHDKVEAVNTLLVAGYYCKAVREPSGASSIRSSPARGQARDGGVLSPAASAPATPRKSRSPRSPVGGGGGTREGKAVPSVASGVPSCRVS